MDKKTYEALARRLKEPEKEVIGRRRPEKALRVFADTTMDMIHLYDKEGRIRFANKATEKLLGYRIGDLEGASAFSFIHPDDRDCIRKDMAAILEGKQIPACEMRLLKRDGSYLDVEASRFMLPLDDHEPCIGTVLRDISFRKESNAKLRQYQALLEDQVRQRTNELIRSNEQLRREIADRRQAEKALRESEERYRDLFENATDLIQIVRPDGRYDYVNRAWRKTFGYTDEEVRNLTIFDVIHPDCRGHCAAVFQRVMAERRVNKIETIFVAKDGRKIMAEGSANCKIVDGRPVSARCMFRDVTEQKRMEKELLKAQKLESIADLAGGIAHDFNNLLTAILGNISLAKTVVGPGSRLYKALSSAEKASLKASRLTQQLITFSKGGTPVKRETDIAEVVKAAARFVLEGSNVRSEFTVSDDLWTVEADEGQMHRVISNLVMNAREAMPEGGTVHISLENASNAPGGFSQAENRNYVVITVTDHGPGIPEDDLARIFDPYFTTKQMGNTKGTGLGLAVCYSIINKHHGLITADSTEGAGATFQVYLPAIPAVQREIPADTGGKDLPSATAGKVLVMDNEEFIRQVTSETLGHFGYRVECAKDGNEALDLFVKARKSGRPFDAVILDLTVPGGVGGREIIKALREIDPGVRAIVSSGYFNDPIMNDFTRFGFSAAIAKPYKFDELFRMLRTGS